MMHQKEEILGLFLGHFFLLKFLARFSFHHLVLHFLSQAAILTASDHKRASNVEMIKVTRDCEDRREKCG